MKKKRDVNGKENCFIDNSWIAKPKLEEFLLTF